MIKLRIPEIGIKHKVKADGKFKEEDVELFKKEIERAAQGMTVGF